MKVLVIDDQRIFKGEDIQHVTTSQEGIALLDENTIWDEVWLDHDLGSDSEGSGSDIVRHIIATRPQVRLFCVHSMNPVAAEYMVSDLTHAGYPAIRFLWSQNQIKELLDEKAMEERGRNPFYRGPVGKDEHA